MQETDLTKAELAIYHHIKSRTGKKSRRHIHAAACSNALYCYAKKHIEGKIEHPKGGKLDVERFEFSDGSAVILRGVFTLSLAVHRDQMRRFMRHHGVGVNIARFSMLGQDQSLIEEYGKPKRRKPKRNWSPN